MLQWKSDQCYIFWVCVCNLRYPVCSAHAPYCYLWPARLYTVFPHYLINDTNFEKKALNTKCVFWFSLQLASETFLILRRTERDMIKYAYWFSCTVPLFLLYFNKYFIYSLEFRKKTNINFYENPWSGSRVFPCGRMGRRTDITKVIVDFFFNFSNAPKKNSSNEEEKFDSIWKYVKEIG